MGVTVVVILVVGWRAVVCDIPFDGGDDELRW